MLRRTRRLLWIIAAVVGFIAVAVFLRFKSPPEAARLLPESDGILYVNLRPLRALVHPRMAAVTPAPDYQQFLDATGFVWERDLDQAAIALHRMADPRGPNGPVAYSMVLVGRLDGRRIATWLAAHAATREDYVGQIIYSLPSDGRTVRIAQIGYDTIAISNTPTPEQIHSILDRHRTAALPFVGSTLLARHWAEIPLLSFAWGMGQIGLPLTESGAIHIFGLALPLPPETTFLASLRWVGSLRLRVEEIAPSDQAATSQMATLGLLFALARGATASLAPTPANRGLEQLLASAQLSTRRDRVVLRAQLPAKTLIDLLETPTSADPGNAAALASAPAPASTASSAPAPPR